MNPPLTERDGSETIPGQNEALAQASAVSQALQ